MTPKKQRLMAVIELGTTSIRMVVGQVTGQGQVNKIDELEHSVSLGRDVLATGVIRTDTTERCVKGIRSFQEVLAEYGVAPRDVRMVATSAVRESRNRDLFRDRVLVATGLEVDVLEQAEVSRLTYRAVLPQLRAQPFFRQSDVMVVEVGGGSTETLLFRKGKVSATHLYRLGALRLRAQIGDEEIPRDRLLGVMRAEMGQMLAQVHLNLGPLADPQMVLLGSDARFACTALGLERRADGLTEIKLNALKHLTRSIAALTVDQLARDYNLTYTEAETLGPSLLIAVTLADGLKLKRVHVGEVSLRTGILLEMATGEHWTAEYRGQVINSALVIAQKYGVDLRHARHVSRYGLDIIKVLRKRFDFSPRDEVIYQVAALLHEAGQAINMASHHKHSQYMIINSDIFGLGERDIRLAALVARYHRRAMPRPSHNDYMALDHADRIAVSKLAAVIRVANALDHLHGPRPLNTQMCIQGDRFVIELGGDLDIAILKERVRDRGQLFLDIFGKQVVLRRKGR